jgi:hypothetical protein
MKLKLESLDFTANPGFSRSNDKVGLNKSSSSTSKKRRNPSNQKNLSLEEKLIIAKQKAQLESKIYDMEQHIKKHQEYVSSFLIPEESSNPSSAAEGRRGVTSVIWHARPKENAGIKLQFVGEEDAERDIVSAIPSKQAAKEYAKKIIALKKTASEEEHKLKLSLLDQQEIEKAKAKTNKIESLKALREAAREEMHAKKLFLQKLEDDKRQQYAASKAMKKIEQKKKEEAEENERLRIREIHLLEESRKMREDRKVEEALLHQRMKIKFIGDKKETEEIIRREAEEQRMRYLEGRRKVIEDRLEMDRKAEEEKMQAHALEVRELRHKIQGRVRMGNFVWHHGKFGFYSDVRKDPVQYIQYDDENGTPYYYDPVYGTSQYIRPEDADIRHHTDDARREYDGYYGEGAYDIMMADRAYKDAVNRDGGWYDAHGKWVTATGYYDSNYEWVQYDGYTDENGKYIKYAKIQGDLNFMV